MSTSMFAKWRRLFTRRHEDVLAVDVGSDSIKVVALTTGQNGCTLNALAMADTPPQAVEESQVRDVAKTAAAVRQAVTAAGADTRRTVVAVGGRQVFLRLVPYPRMTPSELAEAVKWDADRYVPFEPDSYYLDFFPLPAAADGVQSQVLVAAAPKNLIESLVAAVSEAGLMPVAVEVEPLALYRLVTSIDSGLSRVMIVDAGASAVKMAIFAGDTPVITRSIPLGGRRFTAVVAESLGLEPAEAEHFKKHQPGLLTRLEAPAAAGGVQQALALLAAELAREIRRTVEYYQIQHKAGPVEHIYFTGGGILLGNLASFLTAELETSTSVVDPFAHLNIPPRFDRAYLQANAPALALAVGLAWPDERGI